MSEKPTPQRIEEVDVTEEMRGSFLEYAYSVIYARALPDARDGLKPVQRRIVFMMSEMGLVPERGHVKSARVVGDVMGKLHPHGDSAIYDALVRLAQPFSMRVPLVDGHGNFGSLDDGPAAARYTEARLHPAAIALTAGLDEDVVDFVPNYDNQYQQPDVLPAAFPNLLVNGASGIAVGMATNMAPHNLGEVVAAAVHLLRNPDATVSDLMQYLPGPDFPGGGILIGLEGVEQAYETGRGAFKVRATVTVERTGRRTQLVVSELPYMVGPERVIERIKEGVANKRLQGLTAVEDLTDRKHGLRLVIDLKTGVDPHAVLEQLYKVTPLEDSFSINAVALVDGKPQTLGLRELLQVYLDHRLSVVRRRSEHRLGEAERRLHLVEGLLIAIVDIDEVIQLIRTSDDTQIAKQRLMQVFDLSDAQAEYILELRLRRLTKFSVIELETERESLLSTIADLRDILDSRERLVDVVASELEATAEALATPRRTVLLGAAPAAPTAAAGEGGMLADGPTVVLQSATGKVLRVEGDGPMPAPKRRTRHDAVAARVATTVQGAFGIVTSRGRLLRAATAELPVAPATGIGMSSGIRLKELADGLERGETPVGIVPLDSPAPLLIATAGGVVKRITADALPARTGAGVIALKDGDRVVAATPASDDAWVVLIASDGQLLRFAGSHINPQGAGAAGMKGMSLKGDARVIFAGATTEDADVVTVGAGADAAEGLEGLEQLQTSRVKLTPLSEFPPKGRGTGGVASHRFARGEDHLALAWAGHSPLGLGSDGSLRQLPTERVARTAVGVPADAPIGAIGAALGDA